MRLKYVAEMTGLLAGAGGVMSATPATFPASGNVMWYTSPGTSKFSVLSSSRDKR